MFDPADPGPRLFGVPPGADFPATLVAGLCARMAGQPPEAMARTEIFVNTRRMQRRLRAVLTTEGALLLPRIRLVTDLGQDAAMAGLPAAVPPLRRRLELTQLVAGLLDRQPDLAPRSSIYDLADSLADLMDEMQGEGVAPEAIAALDLTAFSEHWARSLAFIDIVGRYFGAAQATAPDAEARQRLVIERLAAQWQAAPPAHPVIVAGSTGSRGATLRFMQAVAGLPQGALVLPGFDFDMPQAVWNGLGDAMTGEDHPQYRFVKLAGALGVPVGRVQPWGGLHPPHRARNRLISLSLRPAPVTDEWMTEGQSLGPLPDACSGLSLIEAASPRAEALAIALRLRQAAEDGTVAALITPDRGLARQVTAALDRWGILPDDSAGRPLSLSPPGRFLRHVAALFGRKLTAEALLTLLKHPLTASGADRGNHLRHTRDLELRLRRSGPAFPGGADLTGWAATGGDAALIVWADWLAAVLPGRHDTAQHPLTGHVARHLALAARLAAGPGAPEGGEPGGLWQGDAGAEALAATEELAREAPFGGSLTPGDYADLFAAVLNRREVRGAVQVHPHIMIWGTLEARVQGAELVILGGLNDGTWPAAPPPDPWLNRQMRCDAGLLLPDRRIGLSAHDYQQAVCAPQVVLSRALRSAEAQTVPSRWLNRLTNLLGGLPGRDGPLALAQMRARGAVLLAQSAALDTPQTVVPPATRPAPQPPVSARPAVLSVTGVRTLIRDPYAIYARHILRLFPLDSLRPAPDAALRGSTLHAIFERFIAERGPENRAVARARLLAVTDDVLDADIPWPAARRLWRARLERVADWFLAAEEMRTGTPALIERHGSVLLGPLGFTLRARPDRIDVLPDDTLHILDYKTTPPTAKQQKQFDKQLLLEAAMAQRGAFAALGPRPVARVSYVGLGSSPKEIATEITAALDAEIWEGLMRLIAAYRQPEQGYAARRAVTEEKFPGDYDHLARFGEWDQGDVPVPQPVGGPA